MSTKAAKVALEMLLNLIMAYGFYIHGILIYTRTDGGSVISIYNLFHHSSDEKIVRFNQSD
jgi:hypothetical protein